MKKLRQNVALCGALMTAAVISLCGCKDGKEDKSRSATESTDEEFSGAGEPNSVSGTNLTTICESTTSSDQEGLSCPLYKCSVTNPTSCYIVTDTSQVPSSITWKWSAKSTGLLESSIKCAVRSGGIEYSCSAPKGLGFEVTLGTSVSKKQSSSFKSRPFAIASISPNEIPSGAKTKLTLTWSGTITNIDDIVSVKIDDKECTSPVINKTASTVVCSAPAITGESKSKSLVATLRLGYGVAKGYETLGAAGTSLTPTSTPTPTPTSTPVPACTAYIFATNTTYVVAAVAGLPGGDIICGGIGSGGTICPTCSWKVLLSDGGINANSGGRIDVSRTFCKKDGAQLKPVALPSQIFSGSLLLPIDRDQNGGVTAASNVWTGSSMFGINSGAHCLGWTDTSGSQNATVGTVLSAGGSWLNFAQLLCNGSASLYCVGQ